MFTGIVAEVGRLARVERGPGGARLRIEAELAGELREGDSIAVEGVCLTAASRGDGWFEADVMNQTLELSTLGELEPGAALNLELPLRAGDRLGGHVVQGHVDGVVEVLEVLADGDARRLRLRLPAGLERYVVERGSLAIAGVSLTVAAVAEDTVEVSLIPETLSRTTLGSVGPNGRLNVELDVLARHVEKLMQRFQREERP